VGESRLLACFLLNERGHVVTTVLCFSSGGGGHYVPLFIIFPRQRVTDGPLDVAPPGTVAFCVPIGGIQKFL